jgi:hypothetical protein
MRFAFWRKYNDPMPTASIVNHAPETTRSCTSLGAPDIGGSVNIIEGIHTVSRKK